MSPYIKQVARERVRRWGPENAGQLAFFLTKVFGRWIKDQGGLTYERWATLRGVVDDTLDEYRRRIIVPYEEEKRKENGDVF